MSARPTIERIWITYLGCILAVTLATQRGAPGHDVGLCVVLHLGVLVLVLTSRWFAVHRSHDAVRLLRTGLAVVGLPLVFSALCWLLPRVHPEPYEYRFLVLDRAVFGADVGSIADRLPAWLVDVLQLVYAAFYGICIASALAAGRGSGRWAFDRAVLLLTGGFLASYLGYLLVPTLAPKVVLAFPHEVTGSWLTPALRGAIDAGETNPWDCFPSGHTMLTVTSLINVWRWHRRWFRWFLVPCLVLIASTVLLRYHWVVDVVAGALLSWPAVRLCDWLADRDGLPRPEARAVTPA